MTRIQEANALVQFAVAARADGDGAAAWDSYQQAEAIVENDDSTEARRMLALIRYNSSNLLADQGEYIGAIALLDDAIAIYQVVAANTGPNRVAEDLAATRKARANTLLRIGALEDALDELNRAMDAFQMLIASGRTDLVAEYAKLSGARALALKGVGRLEAAAQAFKAAATQMSKLGTPDSQPGKAAEHFASESAKLHDLMQTAVENFDRWDARVGELVEFAGKCSSAGETRVSLMKFDEALVILRWLLKQQPTDERISRLAETAAQKAVVAMYAKQLYASERAFREALPLYDRLIQASRDDATLARRGNVVIGLAMAMRLSEREGIPELIATARTQMLTASPEVRDNWERTVKRMLPGV